MKHIESQTQQQAVKWFRLQYSNLATCLFAVPNGGARNAREAAIMKGEGVTAGVADLLLLVARRGFHGMCIEMKTEVGKQSPSQKAWQKDIEKQNYLYVVCRSFDTFKEAVDWYLKEE